MQLYVALFTVLAASLVQDGEAAKCSQPVLDKIQDLYRRYRQVPSGIIKKSIELSPDIEVATTDGYFNNQDNISCIATAWSADGTFISTFVNDDGTTSTSTNSPSVERPGELYNAATKTRRVHIPTGTLVNAFYKCTEEGEEGLPEGLVKVWKGYKSADLKRAIAELESVLGRPLSKRWPDTCDV